MNEGSINAFIIDNGSGFCKAGFGAENTPRVCFPCVVGKAKDESTAMAEEDQKEAYVVGDEAIAKEGSLKLSYPIERGTITSWDDIEKVWRHCYDNELKVQPEERPTLMTETPHNPRANRRVVTELMFETFNVPSLYISIQATLCLHASGYTTGLVLDSGDGITHAVPIIEGAPISYCIKKSDLAGRDVDEQLIKALSERGVDLSATAAQRETARGIKERLCSVPMDYDAEANPQGEVIMEEQNYNLPDGTEIILQKEALQAPEVLFRPETFGKHITGIHEMVFQSITKADTEVRKDLYNNIVLSGGTTLLRNFNERFKKELMALAPSSAKINVNSLDKPDKKHSVWLGGSILSCLSSFQTMWINKAEYEDSGPTIVYRKCF